MVFGANRRLTALPRRSALPFAPSSDPASK
jgi:hypothetical protein